MGQLQVDRVAFTRLVADFLVWFKTAPWGEWNTFTTIEVAIDEWTIHSPRKVRHFKEDGSSEILQAYDGVHELHGKHPIGLACDLLIWLDGNYLTDGEHPIWKEIDQHCRQVRGDFGLGLKFKDANHLSLGEGF